MKTVSNSCRYYARSQLGNRSRVGFASFLDSKLDMNQVTWKSALGEEVDTMITPTPSSCFTCTKVLSGICVACLALGIADTW